MNTKRHAEHFPTFHAALIFFLRLGRTSLSHLSAFIRLRRAKPLLLNNPVILREVIARLRKKSSFVHLFLFFLAGMAVFLLMWPTYVSVHRRTGPSPDMSRQIFFAVHFVEGFVILLLVPILSATSINLEHERRTWELLSTTPLNTAAIFFGKFLASILFIWILLLSLMPIYGLCFTIGGVSPGEAALMLALLTEVVIISALIGLFCSIEWKRTLKSVSYAYILSFFYFVLVPFIRGRFAAHPGLDFFASPFAIGAWYFGFSRPSQIMRSLGVKGMFFLHGIIALTVMLLLVLLCLWRLSTKSEIYEKDIILEGIRYVKQRKQAERKKPKPVPKHPIPESRNPLFVKELRDLLGQYRYRMWGSVLVLFGASVYLIVQFERYNPGSQAFVDWCSATSFWAVLLTPCLVLPYAANCFRREMDHGTWDILATTTLSPWDMVWGKFGAGLFLYSWRFWAFCGPCLIAAISFDIRGTPMPKLDAEVFFGSIILCYAAACFCLSMGMMFSILVRKTNTAYALAFAGTIVVLLGPYILVPIFDNFIYLIYGGRGPLGHASTRTSGLLSPIYLYQMHGTARAKVHGAAWWTLVFGQTAWMLMASFLFCLISERQVKRATLRE